MQAGITELQGVSRRGMLLLLAAILFPIILAPDLACARPINGTGVGGHFGPLAGAANWPMAEVRTRHNGPVGGVIETLKEAPHGGFGGEARDVLTARLGFKIQATPVRQRLRNSTKRGGRAPGQGDDNPGMVPRSARGAVAPDNPEATVGNGSCCLLRDWSQLCPTRGPPINPPVGAFQISRNTFNFSLNSGPFPAPGAGASGGRQTPSSSRNLAITPQVAVCGGAITNFISFMV